MPRPRSAAQKKFTQEFTPEYRAVLKEARRESRAALKEYRHEYAQTRSPFALWWGYDTCREAGFPLPAWILDGFDELFRRFGK